MSKRAAISVRGLTKRFASGVMALGPIDLDVGKGEFVALVGPSGCGKSTLLRVIAGLLSPSGGEVDVGGADNSADVPQAGIHRRATFGFVFQEPTLMPWATALDNVILPLKLSSMADAEARRRAMTTLATIGLAEFAGAYPRELSGGMKMRASIARALVTDPAILLMDEPFAALDEITRFRLNDDLLDLARSLRKTVVFVTHSVFESVYLAERVLVLTARPARVFANVEIAAPPVRSDGFRTSADYIRQCGLVTRALQDAQEEAP